MIATHSAHDTLEQAGLFEYRHWCNWEHDNGKKPPFNQLDTGHTLVSVTDSRTWLAWDDIYPDGFGAGFVLSSGDPFCVIDLDDVIDDDGNIAAWAAALVTKLDSYTEVSPSGHGLHIWTQGNVGNIVAKKQHKTEIYSHSRYITVTFEPYHLAPVRPRQKMLEQLVTKLRPTPATTPATTPAKNTVPDNLIVRYALGSKSGAKFKKLYIDGDTTAYPSQSDAEFALLALLRFWTSASPERMDAIFRQSALMREKWDEKHGEATYGQRTINRVLDANAASPVWRPRKS